MVELVDTLVLGTSAFGRGGSTPSRGTILLVSEDIFIFKVNFPLKIKREVLLFISHNINNLLLITFHIITLFIY